MRSVFVPFIALAFILAFVGCASTPSERPADASQPENQDVAADAAVNDASIGKDAFVAPATPDVAMVTPTLTPPSACFPAMALPPVLSVPAAASSATTIPPGGTDVITTDLLIPSSYGGIGFSVVSVEGQSFANAVEYATTTATGNAWDKGNYVMTTAPVTAGDVVLVSFWARCARSLAETAECMTHLAFQLATTPYTGEASLDITPGPTWKQYFMPFVASTSHPVATAELTFHLNYPNQTLQFSGFSARNYGRSLSLAQLPVTQITYEGRDADAPWRAVAAANIAKNRMANLTVHVLDPQGAPVPSAQVSVNMTRNAFGFGTAQAGHDFLPPGAIGGGAGIDSGVGIDGGWGVDSGVGMDGPARIDAGVATPWDIYRDYLPRLFNIATEENALKWPSVAGDWGAGWGIPLGVASTNWAIQHGLRTRGHNLIWPSWRNSPAEIKDLPATDLRAAIKKHINDEVTALAGKLDHWDVVNEPFDNHEITDLLGNCTTPNCEAGLDEMATWFTQTRALDAKPKLFINDYAILEGGGGTTSHRDEYERVIQGLLARQAPLDGVGLQGHFGTALTSPSDLIKLLDRYGAYKELWITEYDITVTDLLLAGDYTRDFLTVLYSHPAVGGFIMWGFWDGDHWKKNAPLFAQNWKLKPAGVAYYDLVFNKWWTCTGGTTDATGAYVANGHLGDYAVSVTVGAQTVGATASLVKGGAEITVQLK